MSVCLATQTSGVADRAGRGRAPPGAGAILAVMTSSPSARVRRALAAAGAALVLAAIPATATAQTLPGFGPLLTPDQFSSTLRLPTPEQVGAALGLPAPPAPRPDCRVARCVVLSFDDGPRRETTPHLLDTLEREGVRATFFVIGHKLAGNEDLVQRMTRLGMDVENHTWDHPDLRRLPAPAVTDQISRTTDAITRATGTPPRYVRPPFGSWVPGVTPTAGLEPALWDVDTLDWKTLDPAAVARDALAGARPGAVILLHDIHPTTVAAVPAILEGLRARGLTPATLRDLHGVAPAPAPAAVPWPLPWPVPAAPDLGSADLPEWPPAS